MALQLKQDALLYTTVAGAIVLLHMAVLSLPYFWDEAGYYIPAAYDFFRTSSLIPQSTLLTAHPPLLSVYLAAWWKLFGFAPLVTRIAMLLIAAFGLVQVYRLAEAVANRRIAIAATFLTALYPVSFAQASLAHADTMATAFALWGLRWYFAGGRPWRMALAFALAALAKETAIVVPVGLLAWALLEKQIPRFSRNDNGGESWRESATLLLPLLPLAAWYGYQYARTGQVFGETSFFSYNVSATLTPVRFIFAAVQRLWQVFGHMNLWMLTLMVLGAMLLPPLRDDGVERPRIAIPQQLTMLVVIVALVIFNSLVGGALLARYMMPAIPLVIIIAVSTLHRRVRQWPWLVGFCALAFVIGWFISPPYRNAPEDNLAYADYVRLHQEAARRVEQQFPDSRILTAWPASDELTRPELGYVSTPVKVARIENFALEQITLARAGAGTYEAALLFSTKLELGRPMFASRFWDGILTRYFGYHRDLSAEAAAELLGGRIIWQERRGRQWAAIVGFDRIQNAALGVSASYP